MNFNKLVKRYLLFILLIVSMTSCIYTSKTGLASYYADYYQGRQTANGEIFDHDKYTAAHKKLPFGTKVLITNLSNQKQVMVKINDRGPFVKKRIIDLTKKAARELDLIGPGVAKVRIRYKRY